MLAKPLMQHRPREAPAFFSISCTTTSTSSPPSSGTENTALGPRIEYGARRAISRDANARIARTLAARDHHRNRDDARHHAPEQRNDEVEPLWEDQQSPIAWRSLQRQFMRQRAGAVSKLRKSETGLSRASIRQKDVGAVVRLRSAPMFEKFNQ